MKANVVSPMLHHRAAEHTEESAICPLLYTGDHRCPHLFIVTVIDVTPHSGSALDFASSSSFAMVVAPLSCSPLDVMPHLSYAEKISFDCLLPPTLRVSLSRNHVSLRVFIETSQTLQESRVKRGSVMIAPKGAELHFPSAPTHHMS